MRDSAGSSVRPPVRSHPITGALITSDEELERWIEAAHQITVNGRTPEAQQMGFKIMRDLIAQRSPAQIERMEREQGLR